ncbi:MAG: helix-turn-helix transcriptional regulator [Gemmatimonadales bacterium]|nr:helix-turn-helix transcriptional regulator [Gemmatimonadales bacterium]MDZ4390808.1 helix-turn-helix transcriptional regulator [Gemmatimonadales bacterium]
MKTDLPALLRTARLRAGLSQRALAARAGTTQSVVARIELGEVSPTWGTIERLLGAAGFGLDVVLVEIPAVDSLMRAEISRIRALTPEERLAEVRQADLKLR